MKRLLCIWFPNWPIQRFLVARPELKACVVVLLDRDPRRGQVVAACSRVARRHGVCVGMPSSEATALLEHAEGHLSQLGIWPHHPADDRKALESLVTWAEAFSPMVGLDETPTLAGLLLNVTGIAARHGGESKLAHKIIMQLRQQGYWGQLGLAGSVGAAWALAHFGHSPLKTQSTTDNRQRRRWIHIAPPEQTRQTLAPLPVAALRLSGTALNWLSELGVQRIEQLEDLPRAGISSRLGAEVLQRLDQAMGVGEEVFLAHQPQPPFAAQWQAEHPTDRYDVVQQVVEHLSHHLGQQLASQQQGALQLRCRMHCEARVRQSDPSEPSIARKLPVVDLDVSLFQPTTQADYLWQLLQMQLEELHLSGPVSAIELIAVTVVPLCQRQTELWSTDPTSTNAQPLAHLIDRLSNRLGPHVVTTARLRAGALPEAAYVLIPLASAETSRARLSAGLDRKPPAAGHRPLLLIDPPQPVRMILQSPDGMPLRFAAEELAQQINQAWGPERIETAWWQGPSVRRDYYRVHCESGSRFWLFRNLDNQRWFLQGTFA